MSQEHNCKVGFAWMSDNRLKLATPVPGRPGAVTILADICDVTVENVDHLIASLQQLRGDIAGAKTGTKH